MKQFKKLILLIAILLVFGVELFSQNDSSRSRSNDYYTDHAQLLTLKPYLLYKLNRVEIANQQDRLILIPNSPLAIGMAVNYKDAGIAIGIGLPHTASSIDKYGKTNRLDLQFSLFRKYIGIDGHFQLYRGYYNANPEDFMDWNEDHYPLLTDMRTISAGLSGYYVVNNKRFSNKAAVMRTQVQNKSAGSVLLGLFANYDEAYSPSGFFPKELPDTVVVDFDLKGFVYFATGINVGYTYTLVFSKQFYLNAAIISGGGYKYIRVEENDGLSESVRQIHGQVQLRGSVGYEGTKFFAGISASTLIRTINYKEYEIDMTTDQFRFYLGKRLSL